MCVCGGGAGGEGSQFGVSKQAEICVPGLGYPPLAACSV